MDQQPPMRMRRVNSDPLPTKPLPAPTYYNPLGIATGAALAGLWSLYFVGQFGGTLGWLRLLMLTVGWLMILAAIVLLGAGLSGWLSRRKHG